MSDLTSTGHRERRPVSSMRSSPAAGAALLGIGLAVALLAAPAAASPGTENTLYRFVDGQPVATSAASLRTNASGATMSLRTAELDRGAYTVWWVVFNHPEHCTDPYSPDIECGEGDLFAEAVQASVLYATGNVVGGSGRSGFGAHLKTDDTSSALFGPGLTNPTQAEIHAVLRTHGPVIPGMVHEQTHSFNGGCEPGDPNEGLCDDLQFTTFRQRAAGL